MSKNYNKNPNALIKQVFVHHGISFVPIGYKSGKLGDNTAIHGGSPWGAGKP